MRIMWQPQLRDRHISLKQDPLGNSELNMSYYTAGTTFLYQRIEYKSEVSLYGEKFCDDILTPASVECQG